MPEDGEIMSEINIRRRHALTVDDARRLAEEMAIRLNQRFDLAYRWDGDALRFERDGVHGALTVEPGEIQIQARLGFFLSLARRQIEQEIETSLDEMLGAVGDARDAPASESKKGARET
jgi:putative polyhydroxyalkanoate system protein